MRDRSDSPLPRLLVLTDRTQTASGTLASVVRAAVDGGARAVVLREKDLGPSERDAIAARLRGHVGMLIVASDASIAGDGVHLATTDPMPERRPGLVGRSCHDAAEVARAAADGCDYATVSPVFVSASKPGHGPQLGIQGLRALAAGSDLPIYALGGVTPERARACCDAGAHGVAVMGTIMRSRDPAATVRDYLSAVSSSQPGQ